MTTKAPKNALKNARKRRVSRAMEIDLPDFLKSLLSGVQKMQKEESVFSGIPALRLYTYDQMLDITAGFSEALMRIHSAELNSFEHERQTLLTAEILTLCSDKYEIDPHETSILLFHIATELMVYNREHLKKGGDGASV
jgi:hypothetical protein